VHEPSATPQIYQVDAFTRHRYGGNPAGVVLYADSLSDHEMQDLARELNNGDTAFVLRPDAADHDLRVRFFTPRAEAGFVGHATIAVHTVLAARAAAAQALAPGSARGSALTPATTAPLRQKQRTGIVTVERRASAAGTEFAISQPPAPLQAPLGAAELAPVLVALSLQPADLEPRCPALIAGAGSTRLLLGVKSAALLAGLQPDLARLQALSATLGAAGYFLYTLHPALADCDTEARMFCPALGIPEDPVSGNAHGMLGVYLWQQGLLQPDAAGAVAFRGRQGHFMRRPGELRIELALSGTTLQSVAIVGQGVIVFEASLSR
jgi:PhzF family phenazine biosynthesis protein